MSTRPQAKRKIKVLSAQQKLNLIEKVKKGENVVAWILKNEPKYSGPPLRKNSCFYVRILLARTPLSETVLAGPLDFRLEVSDCNTINI